MKRFVIVDRIECLVYRKRSTVAHTISVCFNLLLLFFLIPYYWYVWYHFDLTVGGCSVLKLFVKFDDCMWKYGFLLFRWHMCLPIQLNKYAILGATENQWQSFINIDVFEKFYDIVWRKNFIEKAKNNLRPKVYWLHSESFPVW